MRPFSAMALEMIRVASAGMRGLATREWEIVYPKDDAQHEVGASSPVGSDDRRHRGALAQDSAAAISGSRQGVRPVGRCCLRAVPLLDRQRDPSSRAGILYRDRPLGRHRIVDLGVEPPQHAAVGQFGQQPVNWLVEPDLAHLAPSRRRRSAHRPPGTPAGARRARGCRREAGQD